MKSKLFSVLLLLLSLASVLWLAGCAVNAATGERHLSLVSESQEIQMGRESDGQIVSTMGLYDDPAVQKYVERIGLRLAAVCERPNLPWTFRVIDDPVVNAFALPGGFIYVTRGILTHLNNEAELAGVMGHEVGHVTAQHSVNRISTQQLTQLGLGVGMILKPDLAQYGQLIGQGLGLLFLKFSRDDESQADALGVRYTFRAGDDPRQLIGVMAMLDNVTKASGSSTPEWLSTHPAPVNRIQDLRHHLDTLRGPVAGKKVDPDGYAKVIDGMVYGDNPRDGFFRGSLFLHPAMQFTLGFPSGWSTSNQKQSVQAVSPAKDAAIQLTVSDKKTAAEAMQAFAAQQGFTVAPAKATSLRGFTGSSSTFSATSDQGAYQGAVSFVEYKGNVFQLLGYSGQAAWRGYEKAVRQTLESFDKLTDAKALNVQPLRIKMVKIDKAMSLEQFNMNNPSSVPIETLRIINQVSPGQSMPAGTYVKRVVGTKAE